MKHDTLFTIGAMFVGYGIAGVGPQPVQRGWPFLVTGILCALLSAAWQVLAKAREARRERAGDAKRGVVTTTIREER